MLKALAWKEYREQRQVALLGLLASAMLPVLYIVMGAAVAWSVSPQDIIYQSASTGVVLVWPIFATVTGAATSLREAHVGSLGFLLSRPVSRKRVWAVKVSLGLASLAAVIGGSVVIFWAIPWLIWGPVMVSRLELLGPPELGILVGFVSLAFSCAVLYAALTASALVAAGAGLVSSLAINAFVYGFWNVVGLRRGFELASGIEIALVTLTVLAGSVYAFNQGELLRGPRVRRMVLLQAVLVLGVLFAVSSTSAFVLTRVNLSNAIFIGPKLSPAGDVVAVRANRSNLSAEQIWLIDLEGGAKQLAQRGSRFSAFSPDGKWLAYSVRSPIFRLFPEQHELRLVGTDRMGDRRIGGSMGQFPAFSPDGMRLATANVGALRIAHLDHDEVEVVELPGAFVNWWPEDVTWTPDGGKLLVTLPSSASSWTLAFYQIDSGDFRFFDSPSDWLTSFSYALPSDRPVPSRMPVTGSWPVKGTNADRLYRYRREFGVGLINRETLDSEILVRGICRRTYVDLSADEHFLVYSTCAERDPGEAVEITRDSIVRILDLDNGEDRVLATMPGRISELMFNPSGTRVLATTDYHSSLPNSAAVIDLDGEVRALGLHWSSVGWLDDGRALLARHPDPSVPGEARAVSFPASLEILSLVVLDVETGEQRTVFSR